MRPSIRLASILGLTLVSPAALAAPRTFAVTGADGKDTATFTSKAPFETIVGRTSKVSGEIVTDLDDLSKTTGTVEVDVASLDTGIGMRNEHLKSADYLDVAKHPKATFVVKSVKAAKKALKPGDKTTAKVTGDLSIHGVTKTVTVPAEIGYVTGDPKNMFFPKDTLAVSVTFPVKLADYSVKRPQILILKLADEVSVGFTIQAAVK